MPARFIGRGGYTFTAEHQGVSSLLVQRDTSSQTEQRVTKRTRNICTNTSVHKTVTRLQSYVNTVQETAVLRLFKQK